MINLGLHTKLSYESVSSIIWRVIDCNPSLTFTDWKSLPKTEPNILKGTSFSIADRRILDLYLTNCKQQSLNEPRCITGSTRFDYTLQNCPTCATAHYHTFLYQLPGLKTCPIHNQSLLKVCPECHQKWPVGLDIKKRNCPLCGDKTDHYAVITLRKKIQQASHRTLKNIYKLMSFDSTKKCDWFWWSGSDYHLKYNVARPNMFLRDHRYLSAENYLRNGPKSVNWKLRNVPYEIKAWPIVCSLTDFEMHDPFDYAFAFPSKDLHSHLLFDTKRKSLKLELDPPLVKSREEAIKAVFNQLSKYHPCNHPLQRVKQFKHISLSSDCPYCIAFSAWINQLLIHDFNLQRHEDDRDQFPFYYFPGFKVNCFSPLPWGHLKVVNRYSGQSYRLFETSIDFQAYLYQAELLNLFRVIYFYVIKYYEHLIIHNGNPVFYLDFKDKVKKSGLGLADNIVIFYDLTHVTSVVSSNLLPHNYKLAPSKIIEKVKINPKSSKIKTCSKEDLLFG